ncbi:MAG TPA: quinone-dependent dihydroorotate dehydrogenase [Burkholderiales bacterium]
MSLYGLARPFLFALDPEVAHRLTLKLSDFLSYPAVPSAPLEAMGLKFPNPVGLAAGLDKDAEHIDAFGRIGFGFIEVGTVTPRAQPGNPKPRLFRLIEKNALINRFGFNNVGVDAFLRNVGRARWKGILGINIGKNADTPSERAVDDYAIGLEKVYGAASYVTINISSPNTKNLRNLQEDEQLNGLLRTLSDLRTRLTEKHGRRVPLALKIAPDLDDAQIRAIADAVRRHRFDAVIATNTSTGREGVEGLGHAEEAGGLSGAPITGKASDVLRKMHSQLKNEVALIGAGGIMSGADAAAKRAAGASLVQLYTGLVYRGPQLVSECVSAFRAK